MDQKKFAVDKIGCSSSQWCLVLRGQRNFGYKYAKKAAKTLKTSISVWTDPDTPVEKRREAWERYSSRRG